jgi:hypothetical protein
VLQAIDKNTIYKAELPLCFLLAGTLQATMATKHTFLPDASIKFSSVDIYVA